MRHLLTRFPGGKTIAVPTTQPVLLLYRQNRAGKGVVSRPSGLSFAHPQATSPLNVLPRGHRASWPDVKTLAAFTEDWILSFFERWKMAAWEPWLQ